MGSVVRVTKAQYVGFVKFDFSILLTEPVVYLFQAYEGCPEDPVTCMSLAIASLARAMQRQADNRHHMIAQVIPIHSHEKLNLSYYRAWHSCHNIGSSALRTRKMLKRWSTTLGACSIRLVSFSGFLEATVD